MTLFTIYSPQLLSNIDHRQQTFFATFEEFIVQYNINSVYITTFFKGAERLIYLLFPKIEIKRNANIEKTIRVQVF